MSRAYLLTCLAINPFVYFYKNLKWICNSRNYHLAYTDGDR